MNGGRLAGRVAVVTGASRGIGAAVARTYAAEGASVAVGHEPCLQATESAQKLTAEICAAGGRAITVPVDVTDPGQVETFVAAARTELGTIDIVVNNAATRTPAAWHETTVEQWDHVQRVNLRGPWLMALAAYPDLRASGRGCVINVTSVMVETGQPGALDYTSSKAGVIGLTRALARQVGADGIRVNAVMPGAIRTELEIETEPDEDAVFERITAVQSLKRRGYAADLVGAFVFLAGDESSFITGQVLNVDGGWVHY